MNVKKKFIVNYRKNIRRKLKTSEIWTTNWRKKFCFYSNLENNITNWKWIRNNHLFRVKLTIYSHTKKLLYFVVIYQNKTDMVWFCLKIKIIFFRNYFHIQVRKEVKKNVYNLFKGKKKQKNYFLPHESKYILKKQLSWK